MWSQNQATDKIRQLLAQFWLHHSVNTFGHFVVCPIIFNLPWGIPEGTFTAFYFIFIFLNVGPNFEVEGEGDVLVPPIWVHQWLNSFDFMWTK